MRQSACLMVLMTLVSVGPSCLQQTSREPDRPPEPKISAPKSAEATADIKPAAGPAALTDLDASRIAKQFIEVELRERMEYQCRPGTWNPNTKEWFVTCWRVYGYHPNGRPRFVPGGFRQIVIGNDGIVKSWSPGR